ncbi:MAG TPA: hemolysin III family protein [Acidimicrobiales bacterium]|nr:hemolysin III family protein [Acidimicrobiales bacterium]
MAPGAGPSSVADPATAKPAWRGWLHAVGCPLVVAAVTGLGVASPSGTPRASVAIYGATSVLLFGVSAIYHRGHWGTAARARWRRVDHGNIYLLIAGTYTPVATMGLRDPARLAILWLIWCGAALGVSFRWSWPRAPRLFYTVLYIVLGWSLVPVMGELYDLAGMAVFALLLAGGLCYTAGGVVYALKRPDLSPRVFGFHEVFHACTLGGWGLQFAAVCLLVARAR